MVEKFEKWQVTKNKCDPQSHEKGRKGSKMAEKAKKLDKEHEKC